MKIFSEKGISALVTIGVMLVLSVMGFAVVSLVSTSHTLNTEQLVYDRAFYVTQAGLEYAMRKIYEGVSPVVASPGISFTGGAFTVTRQDRLITVTGNYGASRVVHQVTSPSQADCTEFDVGNADLASNGTRLQHIQMQKICLETAVLDKIRVSWTNPGSEGLTKVRIENSTIYDQPPVPSDGLTELSDYLMSGNNLHNFNEINFTNNMEGKTFTIAFVFGDGSSESHTFTPDG